MTRTPPREVLQKLRKENGYKCCYPGCLNPYLYYHHFDPPWHIRNHHNPDGMIALCAEHHAKADAGMFSIEEMKQMKAKANSEFIKLMKSFDWMKNDILTIAGTNHFFNNKAIAQIDDMLKIWFSTDNYGYELLNVIYFNEHGEEWFRINDNIWEIVEHVKNLTCPPNGKCLYVEFDNGDSFELKFLEIKSETELGFRFDSSYPLTALKLKFNINHNQFICDDNKLVLYNYTFSGCLIGNKHCAILIENGIPNIY